MKFTFTSPNPRTAGGPERLPFRGLTKEEAEAIKMHLENLVDRYATHDALRIVARALGVTE